MSLDPPPFHSSYLFGGRGGINTSWHFDEGDGSCHLCNPDVLHSAIQTRFLSLCLVTEWRALDGNRQLVGSLVEFSSGLLESPLDSFAFNKLAGSADL